MLLQIEMRVDWNSNVYWFESMIERKEIFEPCPCLFLGQRKTVHAIA